MDVNNINVIQFVLYYNSGKNTIFQEVTKSTKKLLLSHLPKRGFGGSIPQKDK